MSFNRLNIVQAHNGLKNKEFSAAELTRAVLDEIRKKDKDINAYLTVTEKLALEQAKKTDERINRGEKIGLLEGISIAVKDNILIKGTRCTAASKMLRNYIAPYDATVIKKLKKAGAVIIGKTNMDEFAMGSSTENSAFGPTKNPHDLTRVAGGTSGGSAAAVAADECIAALGSDTGGSIRQPSSFCGVIGFKPTYGAVSRYGLIAFASSLDQIGPMTKTGEDAQILFDVIKGKDEMDSTSFETKSVSEKKKIKDLRIGIPKEYFIKGLNPEVEKVVREAIKRYQDLGAKIIEVSLPNIEYALPCYYIIMPAEASANLARFDGIKYGLSERAANLLEEYLETRQKGFGDEVTRRIMVGTYVLSAGYYDAYYLKAQKVRTLIKEDFIKAFKKADILLTPTSPTTAFKIGERMDDPISMYLSDIYTVSANLTGLPAISFPCGKVDNLPVGLQLIGKHFEENELLQTVRIYEEVK